MLADLRVLFIGMNHDFSLRSLEAIGGRGQLVGVVESVGPKAEAQKTKEKLDENILHEAAARFAVPFHWFGRDDRPLAEAIESTRCDVLAVVGMARLLRKELYDRPRLGAINLHPSLLPKYRGPEPYFWQYQQMDLQGGVSVFQIDEGLDAGDLLVQKPLTIELGERYLSYLRRTAITGAQAMVETLSLLRDGRASPRPQRHLSCPVFAPFPRSGDPLIDWTHWPLERVWHLLHGMQERFALIAPPPGVDATWAIGPMVRGAVDKQPGEIGLDADGHYAAHGEGKIRLKLISRPSLPRRLATRIARRVRRMFQNR